MLKQRFESVYLSVCMPPLQGHSSGSARTEGYYKMDARLKAKYKYHHGRATALAAAPPDDKKASKMQLLSREARSNQRRLLTAFGNTTTPHPHSTATAYFVFTSPMSEHEPGFFTRLPLRPYR